LQVLAFASQDKVYLVLGLYSFYILDENVSNKKMGIGKSASPHLREEAGSQAREISKVICDFVFGKCKEHGN